MFRTIEDFRTAWDYEAEMTGKVDYSQFAPYKVDLMTMNGKTYGMPFDSGVAGM